MLHYRLLMRIHAAVLSRNFALWQVLSSACTLRRRKSHRELRLDLPRARFGFYLGGAVRGFNLVLDQGEIGTWKPSRHRIFRTPSLILPAKTNLPSRFI